MMSKVFEFILDCKSVLDFILPLVKGKKKKTHDENLKLTPIYTWDESFKNWSMIQFQIFFLYCYFSKSKWDGKKVSLVQLSSLLPVLHWKIP